MNFDQILARIKAELKEKTHYQKAAFILFTCCLNIILINSLQSQGYLSNTIIQTVTIEKVVVKEELKRPLEEIVQDNVKKYNIPKIVVETIIEKESTKNPNAINFEPTAFARAQKLTNNYALQKLYSSSHGYMQVLGLNTKAFNVSWNDLYDPEKNIDIGCHILKDCLDKWKDEPGQRRLFQALVCYNGAEVYARDIISRINNKNLAELASTL